MLFRFDIYLGITRIEVMGKVCSFETHFYSEFIPSYSFDFLSQTHTYIENGN